MAQVPITAMVVHDHALFRQVFREALREKLPGAFVVEAEDMTEAFRMVEEHRPDVAFVGFRLSDGDGVDFVQYLRREVPTCTLGICSREDLPEYRDLALANGAAFFHMGRMDADRVAGFVGAAMERRGAGVGPEGSP